MSARLALQLVDRTGSPVIAPLPESGPRPRPSRGRSDGKRPGPATAVGGYFPPPGDIPRGKPRGERIATLHAAGRVEKQLPALHRETK